MKNLKKFVAALLVLTMVLATGSVAFASSAKFTKKDVDNYTWLKFDGSLYAFDKPKFSSKTNIIVKKGSAALLLDVSKDGKWAELLLSLYTARNQTVTKWFRTDKLSIAGNSSTDYKYGRVIFASGGSDMSDEFLRLKKKIGQYTNKTVVTTGKVNLRKTASLKGKSLGIVKKGEKVKLTGIVGMDWFGVVFFQVNYKGKTYFVSGEYLKVNTNKAYEECVKAI